MWPWKVSNVLFRKRHVESWPHANDRFNFWGLFQMIVTCSATLSTYQCTQALTSGRYAKNFLVFWGSFFLSFSLIPLLTIFTWLNVPPLLGDRLFHELIQLWVPARWGSVFVWCRSGSCFFLDPWIYLLFLLYPPPQCMYCIPMNFLLFVYLWVHVLYTCQCVLCPYQCVYCTLSVCVS